MFLPGNYDFCLKVTLTFISVSSKFSVSSSERWKGPEQFSLMLQDDALTKTCVLKLIERFVDEQNIVILGDDNLDSRNFLSDTNFFSVLLSNNDASLLLGNSSRILKSYDDKFINKRNQAFLLVFCHVEELEKVLIDKRYNQMWIPTNKFILVCILGEECNNLSSMIKFVAQQNILNFVILVSSAYHPMIEIHTWKPFKAGYCADNFENELVGKCNDDEFLVTEHIYENKFPRSYNGCILNVGAATRLPFVEETQGTGGGYEIRVMETMAEKLKLTLKYTKSGSDDLSRGKYDRLYENYTGMLSKLMKDEVDVVVGGYGLTFDRMKHFDLVSSHFLEGAIWCVPLAQPIPPWKIIFFAIDYKIFIIMLIILPLFCVCIRMMSPLNKELRSYRNTLECFFSLYRMTIGVPVQPEPKTSLIRMLCLVYLIYSLIIVTLFKTELTTSMTNQRWSHQVSTPTELLQTDWILKIPPSYEHFFTNKNNEIVKGVLARWNDCYSLDDCLQEIAHNEKTAVLGPRFPLLYESYLMMMKARKRQMYCFEQKVFIYSLHLLARKNFYLYNQLNVMVRRILAAGILKHFIARRNASFFRRRYHESIMISMEHLQTVFFIYSVGSSFSIMVFLIEKITHHSRNRKHFIL